jgi:hypothetical protein
MRRSRGKKCSLADDGEEKGRGGEEGKRRMSRNGVQGGGRREVMRG